MIASSMGLSARRYGLRRRGWTRARWMGSPAACLLHFRLWAPSGLGLRRSAVVEGAGGSRVRDLGRLLPIVDWLPRYDRVMLRGDVLAGIAVTAMIVPKDLGYAGIAGVPVQNGLYAAAAGAIVYALFCTSRHISTGPSSSLAAVAGGAVLFTGVGGAQAAELVAAITLVTGALFLLLALLRLGWIARFLSRAVVTGFLAGAAVDVVIGELPKLTGTSTSGDSAWAELASWIRSLGNVSGTTLLVGVAALVLILGLRFYAPRLPGALVLVVAGLLTTRVADLGTHGVALVGHVPRGLPALTLPGLAVFQQHYSTIFAAAAGLLLIGFSQTAGDARAFAVRHHYRIDINQESIAQGMANAASGIFQGMPVSTSLSASSLNESSGAQSPMASLATGGFVILTLIALAPLFSQLPKAVLAAIIIDAVVFGMIDIPELRRLYRVKRFDFWIAVAAVVAVLSAGVLAGVVIGIALSLVWLIYVATAPGMPVLGREPGTQVFRDVTEDSGYETFPGIVVMRLDGGLFFATADALEERIRGLVAQSDEPTHALVLDLEGVDLVDSHGAAKLNEILDYTESVQIELRLARLKRTVASVLERDGVLERLGPERTHGNVHRAVEAQLAADRSARRLERSPRTEDQ
jgi:sulfate permease, SulP family